MISRIEYIKERYPHVFLLFGSPMKILPGEGIRIQQLNSVAEKLRNDLRDELIKSNYGHVLFYGRRSEHTEYKKTGSGIND
jgi:hypothetical protein